MVMRKATIWGALAMASVLESIRRKDLWVAAILSVLMIGAAGMMGRFGVKGLETFLKSAALNVVNLLSVVLAVLFAARQIPEEVSRRTVYPLLARPISRGDLLFGKFLGAYALSLMGLLLFSLIAFGALKWFGLGVGAIFWQYVLLRAMVLGIVCAVTMGLSVFVTPQAAVTLSLLLALISQTFASAVLLMEGEAERLGQLVLRGTYFALPQFNLFDLSSKVSHGWDAIPATTVLQLGFYGLLHVVVWLTVGVQRFHRQAL
jgi:ABC-type transport system involved in multi-copper enzyme maturation permease subunit